MQYLVVVGIFKISETMGDDEVWPGKKESGLHQATTAHCEGEAAACQLCHAAAFYV